MRGSFAITEIEVKYNKMNWNVFDFFKDYLKREVNSPGAGWYAYKLEKGIYCFKWTDSKSKFPDKKYLDALKLDNWIISITSEVIQDTFK